MQQCEAGYPAEHVLTPPSPPGQQQPEAQPTFQQTPTVRQLLSDQHPPKVGSSQMWEPNPVRELSGKL